jgi:hypothetical protein
MAVLLCPAPINVCNPDILLPKPDKIPPLLPEAILF